MQRRIFEFVMFFLTGLFLVAALTWWQPNKNEPKVLVDTHCLIPVFATDTTVLYDIIGFAAGVILQILI